MIVIISFVLLTMVSLFLSSSLFLHQHLHYYALLPFLLFVSSSSRLLFVFCSFLSLLLTFSLLLRCFSCHLLRSCTFYKWLCACLLFAAVWRARGTTTRVSLAYFAVTSFACFFPSIMLHCVYYACFDHAVLCCITAYYACYDSKNPAALCCTTCYACFVCCIGLQYPSAHAAQHKTADILFILQRFRARDSDSETVNNLSNSKPVLSWESRNLSSNRTLDLLRRSLTASRYPNHFSVTP